MAIDTQTITTNEFKLQQVSKSAYKLISWYEAALLSNRSPTLFRLPIPPLNLVLRGHGYASVCGIAYLRKRLQEGKVLHVYISDSYLQGHTLQLLLPDAQCHGSPAGEALASHPGYTYEASEASDLQITSISTPSHSENQDIERSMCTSSSTHELDMINHDEKSNYHNMNAQNLTLECTNCKRPIPVAGNGVANYGKGQRLLCSGCRKQSHVCVNCRGIYTTISRDLDPNPQSETEDYINMCQSCLGIPSEQQTLCRGTCNNYCYCKCNLM